MWLIKDSKGKIKYLKPGETIKFGRKQADIVLANDTSISRSHATLAVTLKSQSMASEVSSTCIVKDCCSKYGTSVLRNGIQIKASAEGLELQHTDKIRFGLQHHTFMVEYINFVTVTSRLNSSDKMKLKEIIDSIGGVIIDCYYNYCTHLTMTSATSTNKLIFALIAGIPIVNINYWISVVNAINTDSKLPDPNLFTPLLQDKGVNSNCISLQPNARRKTLFQGKTFFFFLENTYSQHKKMIEEAGGVAELHLINENCVLDNFFCDNNLLIQITNIDDVSTDVKKFNAILYKKMCEKKIRMIAETEIPLAIIYVSLEQYCNPKYHFKKLIERKKRKKDTSEIFVLDTQDISILKNDNININEPALKKKCIPETDEFVEKNVKESLENVMKDKDHQNDDRKLIAKQFSRIKNDKKSNDNITLLKKKFSEPIPFKIQGTEIVEDISHHINHEVLDENNKFNLKIVEDKKIKNINVNTIIENFRDTKQCDRSTLYKNRKHDKDLKKNNKLDKWGFKKSIKKNVEFDLDDLDLESTNDLAKKKISTISTNKESTNTLKNKIKCEKFPKSLQKDEKVFNKLCHDKNLVKKINQNWTFTASLKVAKIENTNLVKENISKQCSIHTDMQKESAGNINNVKLFKKVYNQIPMTRIKLEDMSALKSNI